MDGKTARGASSPANPALHIPDPLSTTSAAISSSMAELQKNEKPSLEMHSWQARAFQGACDHVESTSCFVVHSTF